MLQINQQSSQSDRATGDQQHRAFRLIREMMQIEKTLVDYEAFARTHQDVRQRIADLFILDVWYRRNIGVAFRHRREFRKHLFDVLNKRKRSTSDAQETAEIQGSGLPEPRQIIAIQNGHSD